jgi:hypothetical protein
MQTVLVYNPTTTPAVYGDGQTLGGMEWLEVGVRYVDELLEGGCILVPDEGTPPVDSDASLADDVFLASDEVPSDPEDTVAEESDDPVTDDEPATISKPRRRKSPSEKE